MNLEMEGDKYSLQIKKIIISQICTYNWPNGMWPYKWRYEMADFTLFLLRPFIAMVTSL